METELTISMGGFPQFSARGCEQELIPIDQGEFHRTVNGDLIYLAENLHTKYKTIIQCVDKSSIATDGLYRGAEVTIGCIQRLWQKIDQEQKLVQLDKNPVVDSVFAQTSDNQTINVLNVNGREVQIEPIYSEGFVCYRPLLKMKVVSYSLTTNEWGVKVGWKIECEEI